MNKFYLFILLLPVQVFGQAVPNGAFEAWTSINYDEADGFYSSNRESLRKGDVLTAFKTSDSYSGSAAIKLETVKSGNDTLGAYVTNSAGDPVKGDGGFPFAAIPTHINGYCKYNLPGNDSALLLVIFKKDGDVINMDLFKFKGTGSQSTYVPFSFPLTLSSMPDSVILGAASSNLIGEVGIEPGSTLYLDQLSFSGATAMPAIQNGDFENWSVQSFDIPDGWNVQGEGVIKTTDSYSGTYAILMETVQFSSNEFNQSGITTGEDTQNGPPRGGRPYTLQTDTLTGYYKYSAGGTDSAQVFVNLSKNGTTIGGGMLHLGPKANYTYFQLPFSSGIIPDTMRIDIYSSKWPPSSEANLLLDNLQLKSQPLGYQAISWSALRAYPNPASKDLVIDGLQTLNGSRLIRICNVLGEAVLTVTAESSGDYKLDVTELQPGIYFCYVDGELNPVKFIRQ